MVFQFEVFLVLTIAQNQWLAQVQHPLRRAGFLFALVYVFIEFSGVHELIAMATGVKPYILIVVTVPMMLLVLGSGGFQRTLRCPVAKYWIGFAIWMIISVPFSSWRGQSMFLAVSWIRAVLPILFAIAGCVMTVWEFNRLMTVLAAAAAVNVLAGRLFANQISGRLELSGSTISDPNDYAAHLILVLPFLLLVVADPRRSVVVRAVASVLAIYGLYLILSTGSRGGLLAVGVAILFCLWKLRPRQKITLAVVAAILACVAIAVLPQQVLSRFVTIFSSDNKLENDGALSAATESAEARNYLLRQSVLVTLSHPFFGVGMGQFQNYEGEMSRKAIGGPGYWNETHNSFTQASSEMGIPALLFYLAAIIATYRMLDRVYGLAQQQSSTPGVQRIKVTAFYLLLSLVGFCAASFFLSLAYRFYLPAFAGLAIALTRAVKQSTAAAPTRSPDIAYALDQ
ncbi:MAG: hypothetical protein DMG58_16245 [Acidobacteria bacterium]|nr:MAG: hypothetical protein DMG58_16245 [Acidobacteriota bacterium]